MKWSTWLENWGMTQLKISVPFLEMEWGPSDADKNAAWELYIELLTRTPLDAGFEDELEPKTTLDTAYSLMPVIREIIKRNGKECTEFAKIAIIVVQQVIRPFLARWHKQTSAGALQGDELEQFTAEFDSFRDSLMKFAGMLANMAGVEDLTHLSNRAEQNTGGDK